MEGTPLPDALDVEGAGEVVGVGRTGEPGLLAGALAGGATFGLGTEALAAPIAGIGDEKSLAVQAIGINRRTGHRQQEDANGP